MKYYSNMRKKQKTIFHSIVLSVMALIFIFVDPTDETTFSTIASFVFTILLIIEIVIIIRFKREKKKIKEQKVIDDNKPKYVKFYESAPYNHENWLRVFGYKRSFLVLSDVDIKIIDNSNLKIDYKDSELLVYHNDNLIGRLSDADLIGHVRSYWEDNEYEILPLLQEIDFISGTAKLQVNFFKHINLLQNPKIKVVENKLVKVDETQQTIESTKIGTYLKVYRDDEKTSRIYVTDKYGETLGDVKKEVAKLIDEYFDNGYVIARLKDVIDQVDHTDALVEFFLIQKNV